MISKVYQVSDERFYQIIKDSCSYSECLRKLGLVAKGGSSTDILKRRIEELNCDISHFSTYKTGTYVRYSMDEILVENSSYANIARLKIRLVNEGYLEYRCNECGIIEWQGQQLSLHLNHKNGKNNDHRLNNLEFLCPNCHSLTDNYAGKNKGKI